MRQLYLLVMESRTHSLAPRSVTTIVGKDIIIFLLTRIFRIIDLHLLLVQVDRFCNNERGKKLPFVEEGHHCYDIAMSPHESS